MRPALPAALALLLTASTLRFAASASAQPAPDVLGTWELVEAVGNPYEDSLVFARVTFTESEVRTVFVFLDPDDGELIGQVESARYVVSAGQLVVRDAGDTTVLDVRRDGDRLDVHDLETGVLLRLHTADPAGSLDPALVGAWRGRRDGQPLVLRFGPDGAASVQEGDGGPDDEAYVVAGPYLLLGDAPFRYAVEDGGGRLVFTSDRGVEEFLPLDG